jgi:predicted 3-demethylubiquinone-9 3-methyltransferase (glyoxalase superfamily)
MSKVSPCLWFDGEAEEAAKPTFRCCRIPKIENVQKNTVDGPSGKGGHGAGG